MSIKNKIKNEEAILIVGSLLLIIALALFHYEKILEINNEIYNNIQSKIYQENNKNNLIVNIDVDYITETDINIDNKEVTNKPQVNYLAFLEIPKINLNQGILPKTSYYNNVNYHVQILDISDLPDVINGNMVLAAHSGSSNIAYFKNLYKLTKDDKAYIIYNNKKYSYQVVNIYNQVKKGSLNIYRDINKTTLTLITCTKDDKNSQTVYILELTGVETY
ncbi:MAG: sortase [Bacilli bacterium]